VLAGSATRVVPSRYALLETGQRRLTLSKDFGDSAVVVNRPPGFAVERAPLSGAPGVLVRGEVDIDTAPQLTAALDAAIRESRGLFVVDLCDVDFLDSSGVHVLVRARAVLGREERALVIVCPPGPARRIFEAAGIDDLLSLFDSRDHAAAALQPAM
jgi:anti-sigma B factor antagonist